MSRAPERATTSGTVYLQVRLPGQLKNEVIDAAGAQGVSVNTFLLQGIQNMLREGMPPPAPGAPLPTSQDALRSYLLGETLLGPCGNPKEECGAMNDDLLSGDRLTDWCGQCGIRLT